MTIITTMKTMYYYSIQVELLIQHFISSDFKDRKILLICIEAESEAEALAKFDVKQIDIIKAELPILAESNPRFEYYEPLYTFKILNRHIITYIM